MLTGQAIPVHARSRPVMRVWGGAWTLTLRFAGDPEYCDAWRPEVALFASGRLVHET
ncbi:hypothetical protein AB0M05_08800 [Streptomyces violaceusniger]|uniref:hypothetical protein n=1 Tax=Streptomyces violaceusniger TaxID=68280 RepID=UPI00343BECA0